MPRLGFCYDPMPATATPGGVATSAAPAPAAPAAAAPPVSSTPPPAAPSPAAPATPPELPMDAVIAFDDGRRVPVADLLKQANDGVQMSADERKQWDLFKRSQAGDPQAILEIMGVKQQPEPPTPPNPLDLQAELKKTREEMERLAGPIRQIETFREQGQIGAVIKTHADKVPYLTHALSQNPQAISEVHKAVEIGKQAAAAAGHNPDDPRVYTEIVGNAIVRAELNLRQVAGWFGSTFAPKTQAQTVPAIGPDGKPLPTVAPSPGAPGASLSPTATHQPSGKFNRDDLLQRMRDSNTAAGFAQQLNQ